MYVLSRMTTYYIQLYFLKTYSSIAVSFWFLNPHPPLKASSESSIEAVPPTPDTAMMYYLNAPSHPVVLFSVDILVSG